MRKELTQWLVCPACHSALTWTARKTVGREILEGTASCTQCRTHYPIHDGVGAFKARDQTAEDLWEEADTGIQALLREEPRKVRRLLNAPVDGMNPSDLLLRGFILESTQGLRAAKPVIDLALERLYSPETHRASRSQMQFVRSHLRGRPGFVVDLASGRGSLLEFLLPGTRRQFVATDMSPRVLRGDLQRLREIGFGPRISALAFDARQSPFADQSVPTLVTNVGLMNIKNPGGLLRELRRIVSGTFFAITAFYPEKEGPNSKAIRELGLVPLLHRRSALREFRAAGFSARVCNFRKARTRPTPEGEIMKGFQPDRLPVVDTELGWCTIVAE